MKVNTFTADVV